MEQDAKNEAVSYLDGIQRPPETTSEFLSPLGMKQTTVSNTIKEIISDIDCNIREQERVSLLKQEEQKLLQKQHELSHQIEEQQQLVQKLATQTDFMQQKQQEQQQQQQLPPPRQMLHPQQTPPLFSLQQLREQQQQQYHHHQNPLQRQDVQQFQTPLATVAKYTTHEESRDGNTLTRTTTSYEAKESSNVSKQVDLQKIFTPATDAEEIIPKNRKLYASSAFYSPNLHPTVEDQVALARRISHSLSDISNHQSKGQSMYSNRKKRSVKWVHEGPDNHSYQTPPPKPPTSPNLLPAYSDAGKHRVQLNLHQEQLLEKYAKPGLRVIKSPWEAALECGSASAAFVEEKSTTQKPYQPSPTTVPDYSRSYQASPLSYETPKFTQQQHPTQKASSYNPQRDLAYKPSLPQGWKGPAVSLPKELYIPKEIPLESYAPPPTVNIKPTCAYSQQQNWNSSVSSGSPFDKKADLIDSYYSSSAQGSNFPSTNKSTFKNDFASGPKQFPVTGSLLSPTHGYKKVTTSSSQKFTQVNYNPSPLPYQKLAKFEGTENDGEIHNQTYSPSQQQRYLQPSVNTKIRNTSPTPFHSQAQEQLPQQEPQYLPTQHEYSYQQPYVKSPVVNTQGILHGSSYNNSPRGWHTANGKSSPFHMKPRVPYVIDSSIPYSDF